MLQQSSIINSHCLKSCNSSLNLTFALYQNKYWVRLRLNTTTWTELFLQRKCNDDFLTDHQNPRLILSVALKTNKSYVDIVRKKWHETTTCRRSVYWIGTRYSVAAILITNKWIFMTFFKHFSKEIYIKPFSHYPTTPSKARCKIPVSLFMQYLE